MRTALNFFLAAPNTDQQIGNSPPCPFLGRESNWFCLVVLAVTAASRAIDSRVLKRSAFVLSVSGHRIAGSCGSQSSN
ncbi:hypothetical protein PoB_007562000 [Plakobranchus ocellatus]|uniref:Uncharacterized protein n=1 Tax=Plakobranchus ocellatus TaxID=259542 RepID=A0AAV4DYM1_9GAST|nr:hypothetical protein PoB_007562000 [Plakobranchus ocellatus]